MKNMKGKIIISLAMTVAAAVLFAAVGNTRAYADDADCESNYGGGETCVVNKRFRIEKEVRLEGDDTWRDKVTIDLTDKDERKKYIEFKIKVTNKSDEYEDMDYDNMKMKDDLPDELDRIGGDDLKEEWDNFEPGETKTFKIKVELDDDERDRDGNFTDCVVNKAKVYFDGDFEGEDSATVCYKHEEGEVLGLPSTGATSTMALAGLAMIAVGTLINKSKKYRTL